MNVDLGQAADAHFQSRRRAASARRRERRPRAKKNVTFIFAFPSERGNILCVRRSRALFFDNFADLARPPWPFSVAQSLEDTRLLALFFCLSGTASNRPATSGDLDGFQWIQAQKTRALAKRGVNPSHTQSNQDGQTGNWRKSLISTISAVISRFLSRVPRPDSAPRRSCFSKSPRRGFATEIRLVFRPRRISLPFTRNRAK